MQVTMTLRTAGPAPRRALAALTAKVVFPQVQRIADRHSVSCAAGRSLRGARLATACRRDRAARPPCREAVFQDRRHREAVRRIAEQIGASRGIYRLGIVEELVNDRPRPRLVQQP
jgi:hypothetical protein